jgi:hypothetical protein
MAHEIYKWRVRTVAASDLEAELNNGLCEDAKRKSKEPDRYNTALAFDLYAILPVPGSERLFTVIGRREFR